MSQNNPPSHLDLALDHYRAGRHAEAWAQLEIAREQEPENPGILRFMAVIAAQSSALPMALSLIKKAILLKPNDDFSYADCANMLGSTGQPEAALKNYRRSSHLAPHNPTPYYNLGNLLRDQGRVREALENFGLAASMNPLDPRPSLNKGLLQRASGDLLASIQSHKAALCFIPHEVNHMEALAGSYNASGLPRDALSWFWRALFLNPASVSTLINLSDLLNNSKDPTSTRLASRAICLEPQDVRAYVNLGISLQLLELPEGRLTLERLPQAKELHRFKNPQPPETGDEEKQNFAYALQYHDRALVLSTASPEAHLNRGIVLMDLNRYEEAMASTRRAIALKPELAAAHANLTVIREEIDLDGDYSHHLDHAITLDPNDADTHYVMALSRLGQGRFEEGWKHYQWRWRAKIANQSYPPHTPQPWNSKTAGGRLWVWPEQGLGDEILYGRFLGPAQRRVDSLLASVETRLIPLFARSFPEITFLPKERVSSQQYDHEIALGDLPGRFLQGGSENVATFAQTYLKSDATRTEEIKKSLGAEGKILCGIAWQSKRKKEGPQKSVSLEDLRPLLSMDGVLFVNLQYGDVSDQIADFYASSGIKIRECDTVDTFSDLDGLASLIDACDVIVSTSNTAAHLAGALGKEAHILLPSKGRALFWYWRNQIDNRSEWYPSLRLYPKDTPSGWGKPLAEIRSNIMARFFPS